MAVGRVEDDGIHSGFHKEFGAVHGICRNAHACRNLAAGGLCLGHLLRLAFRRHILMKNPYAAFFCKSYGHRGFCDGIHCRGGERDIQGDVLCKLCFEGNFPRQYLRPCRYQKYVVEG